MTSGIPLTPQKRLQIAEAAGTYKEISIRLKVSTATVGAIKRGLRIGVVTLAQLRKDVAISE